MISWSAAAALNDGREQWERQHRVITRTSAAHAGHHEVPLGCLGITRCLWDVKALWAHCSAVQPVRRRGRRRRQQQQQRLFGRDLGLDSLGGALVAACVQGGSLVAACVRIHLLAPLMGGSSASGSQSSPIPCASGSCASGSSPTLSLWPLFHLVLWLLPHLVRLVLACWVRLLS